MSRPPRFSFDTWRLGRLYFSSDWHLGHERIIPLCGRPFGSVEEMNETIIENVNATVSARDTLVLLGDTAMGKLDETLQLLRQVRAKRIWILPGNHDRFSLGYRHSGSTETQRIKRGLWRVQYESQRHGLRVEPDQVPSAWTAKVRGRPVALSHYPYAEDSGSGGGGGGDRYRQLRPRNTGLPLLHGHVHEKWKIRGPMFNVGVDVNGFKPVAEWELADWLDDAPMGAGAGERRMA